MLQRTEIVSFWRYADDLGRATGEPILTHSRHSRLATFDPELAFAQRLITLYPSFLPPHPLILRAGCKLAGDLGTMNSVCMSLIPRAWQNAGDFRRESRPMHNIACLPDKTQISIGEGETILAASLRAGVPHAHACGGRARCSTCRVWILEGLENCSERNELERAFASPLRFGPEV